MADPYKPQEFIQRAGETRLLNVTFQPNLPAGGFITATPTVRVTTLEGVVDTDATQVALESGDAPVRASFLLGTPQAHSVYRINVAGVSNAGETIIIPAIVKVLP